MSYYAIAKRIAPALREEMLLGNYIYKAVAKEDDSHMIMLFIIYKNYIEPLNEQYQYENGRIINACQLCLTNILDKFKTLEPYLIQLEKEFKLIEA
jgi:hypothetical protein